jgi:Mrp family chromosome partitioning ATPase
METYLQLFLKSIKSDMVTPGKCVAVAFTASRPGEGVSFVVESFAAEIAKRTRRRVLVADSGELQQACIDHPSQAASQVSRTDLSNLFVLTPFEAEADCAAEHPSGGVRIQVRPSAPTAPVAVRKASTKLERGLLNLQALRHSFDFILIDCSSLAASGDAAMFAPSVEGVVMVVEADRTRKDQVRNSINTIKSADGNFLGCVLNKRSYTVPGWIYNRF